MAEKQTIIELDINVDAAITDSKALMEEIELLKSQAAKAKKEQGELSEEYIKYTAALKTAQKDLRVNRKLTEDAISADIAKTGSIEQMRKQLSVVSVQWAKLSKEERENTKRGQDLTKQKTELTEALKAEEKATGDNRRNVGNYTDGLGDAIAGTTGFNTSLLTLAANPVVGVITAIVGLFTLLKKAIDRNEKASENLNKIFAVFKGVLDGILNALGPIVEFLTDKLVKAFENPTQAVKDLGNAILENLINRVKAFLVVGDAFSALLDGDFKKAAKLGADAAIQFATGVENGTDKIVDAGEALVEFGKTVVEETDKAIDANKRLANSERELLRIQKQFELQQLNFQKLAEDQRQIRDDEAKSIEERIFANQELGRILDEQLKKELNLANQQLKFAELRKQADGDTLETEEAIFDARIKIAEINERIDAQRSEQLTNTNALLKEQEELEFAAIERELDAFDREIALEIEKQDRLQEIKDQARADEEEARLLDLENQYIIQQDNIFATLELEREGLELQKAQELAFAESVGADTNAINEKYAKAATEIDKAQFNARLSLASGFAGDIAQIAGEGTAIGKAAAVAQTTISTFQAATGSYASLSSIPVVGPALGIAAAAAAVAAGLANVKKILSVKSGLPGDKSPGGGGISASTPTASSPPPASVAGSLNQGIVSRDTANIGTGEDLTIQPTLVTDDVTVNQNKEAANNQTATV